MRTALLLTLLTLLPMVAVAEPNRTDGDGWITLGHGVSTASPLQRIGVPTDQGRLRALRIECSRGAPRIQRIFVEYSDHQTERLTVDAHMKPEQWRAMALDGRRLVLSVTVVSDTDYPGAFVISGI